MRIVVTGASGNLGTALLRRLAADGGHDVVGVVRRPPVPQPPYDGVQWHRLDLTSPQVDAGLDTAFAGADAVVHLAWGFQPSRDVNHLERLGVGGSRAVLDASVRAGVAHLVHMSSVGAYAPAPGRRVDESFSTSGSPTSPYSRHKVAVERLLDSRQDTAGPLMTRLRPGFVLQRDAGSALLRYGAPAWLPSGVVRALPLLPLDRRLTIPVVHADDVANAVVRVLTRRIGGAFNLAGEPAVGVAQISAALGARHVQVPAGVLAAALRAGWWARVQPLDPSWLDLAFSVPLLDTGRARRELDWTPTVPSDVALQQAIDGMADGAGTDSAVMRPRSLADNLTAFRRGGPTSLRRRT